MCLTRCVSYRRVQASLRAGSFEGLLGVTNNNPGPRTHIIILDLAPFLGSKGVLYDNKYDSAIQVYGQEPSTSSKYDPY